MQPPSGPASSSGATAKKSSIEQQTFCLCSQESPLAMVEGAEERRQLKRAAGASAGLTGRASGAVEPDRNRTHAGLSICYNLITGWGAAAVQQPPRQATSLEAGVGPASLGQPQPARLQAYEGHAVAFVGRSLWCLKCFEVPRSAHRSWRNGRCGGVRPPTAMPPALRDAVLRQPAACSKLHASIRARWAELAGALRLQ